MDTHNDISRRYGDKTFHTLDRVDGGALRELPSAPAAGNGKPQGSCADRSVALRHAVEGRTTAGGDAAAPGARPTSRRERREHGRGANG